MKQLRRHLPYSIILLWLTGFVVSAICLDAQSDDVRNRISVIQGVVTLCTGVGTLFIAVSLYQRFGIEKTLLDRQSEIVFKLIEQIGSTRFLIGDGGRGIIQVRMREPFNQQFEYLYGERLLFTPVFFEDFARVSSLSDSPFMPKSIALKFTPLVFSSISGIVETNRHEYSRIQVLGAAPRADSNEKISGLLNGEEMTVQTFLGHLDGILEETKTWLRKHSDLHSDLNF